MSCILRISMIQKYFVKQFFGFVVTGIVRLSENCFFIYNIGRSQLSMYNFDKTLFTGTIYKYSAPIDISTLVLLKIKHFIGKIHFINSLILTLIEDGRLLFQCPISAKYIQA